MARAENGLKECPDCKSIKAIDDFGRATGRADGCRPYCRQCVAKRSKKMRDNRTGRPTITIPGTKFCTGCKATKASDEFHKNSEELHGLSRLCKPCISAICSKRRQRYAQADAVARSDGFKWCGKCKTDKAIHAFHKCKGNRDHLDKYCRDCQSKRQFARYLKCLYGMTVDEYDDLSKSQNHVCYLCNKPETLVIKGKLQRLMVDHCHKTSNSKNFRRLLCNRCNISVGGLEYLRDNGILEKSLQYLEDHQP